MSQEQLETFFYELQQGFLDGNLEELVSRFDTPLVVYSASGVVVLHTSDDVINRMSLYRDALLALTALTGKFELVSEDSLINNRLRVTVRAIYFSHDGEEVTSSLARYFLRRDNGLIIEMIEYLEAALPSDDVDQIIH